MSKRCANSPPPDQIPAKRQKMEHVSNNRIAEFANPILETQAPDANGSTDTEMPEAPVLDEAESTRVKEILAGIDIDDPSVQSRLDGRKMKKLPIKDSFIPWEPTITIPPRSNFWGVKPMPGDPRPHPNQPAARTSDAATNPPMWEDRKFRIKRGSRYVKYFGPIEPDDADSLPNLDQENLIVLKLIDMRPTSRENRRPKCAPLIYAYEGGKPKDWNDRQAIKCINDRRSQAIDRVTLDAPWTRIEREYLASLFRDFPNASIWEMTERFNGHFVGKEFATCTAFTFTPMHGGRTVESVRYQYMTYKPLYDLGQFPSYVRYRNDNSLFGRALRASKKMEDTFGPPSKALQRDWDQPVDGDGSSEPGDDESNGDDRNLNKGKKTTKKGSSKKRASKKKSASIVVDSDDDAEARDELSKPMAEQSNLGDTDEELLELAGAYDRDDTYDSQSRSDYVDTPSKPE